MGVVAPAGPLTVYKVVIRGPQLRGERATLQHLPDARREELRDSRPTRAQICLVDTAGERFVTTARIDDFPGGRVSKATIIATLKKEKDFNEVAHLFIEPEAKELVFKPGTTEKTINECKIPEATKEELRNALGIPLSPTVEKNGFTQTFVAGPVIERANFLLKTIPELSSDMRMQPLGDDINPEWNPKDLKEFTKEDGSFDWEKFFATLQFKLSPADQMFFAEIDHGGQWPQVDLVPFGKVPTTPAAAALNYGVGIFEGIKASRDKDGNIVIFRPRDNARRAIKGAERLCMDAVPEDYFMDAIIRTVLANERWIPPYGQGDLYIRPIVFGSGGVVGISSGDKTTFIVLVTAVGPYFKGGLKGIHIKVETEFHRSAQGIVGFIKAIGNYAASIWVAKKAKATEVPGYEGEKYSEVIYLSAGKDFNKDIEEVGAANFFGIVKRKWHDTAFVFLGKFLRGKFTEAIEYATKAKSEYILYTPESETILPGITRDSTIELAQELGYEVRKGKVPIRFIMRRGVGAFCTGTAAVVSPLRTMTYQGKVKAFEAESVVVGGRKLIGVHPVAYRLYKALTAIQGGRTQEAIDAGLSPEKVARYQKEWRVVVKAAPQALAA